MLSLESENWLSERNPDPRSDIEPPNISGAVMNPDPRKNPEPLRKPEPCMAGAADSPTLESMLNEIFPFCIRFVGMFGLFIVAISVKSAANIKDAPKI